MSLHMKPKRLGALQAIPARTSCFPTVSARRYSRKRGWACRHPSSIGHRSLPHAKCVTPDIVPNRQSLWCEPKPIPFPTPLTTGRDLFSLAANSSVPGSTSLLTEGSRTVALPQRCLCSAAQGIVESPKTVTKSLAAVLRHTLKCIREFRGGKWHWDFRNLFRNWCLTAPVRHGLRLFRDFCSCCTRWDLPTHSCWISGTKKATVCSGSRR